MDVTVLLATVPRPFKHNAIYDVIQEARVVSQVINQHISREQLTALPDATATSVLERAPKANILHLACHGEQNAKNALASGFYMRDEMLTIGQLLGMEHPSAFLAVLSACETAKNDVRQPDEAMSLAAAMFFAGFKSVVGTMW